MSLSDILLLEQMPVGAVAIYDVDPDVPVYYWDQGKVHKQTDNRRHLARFQTDSVDPDDVVCALLRTVVEAQGVDSMFDHPFASIRHPDTPNPMTYLQDYTHRSMPRDTIYLVQEPELLGRRVLSTLGEWAYFVFNPDAVCAIDLDLAIVYGVLNA
jgi:hypothetical protein